MRRFIMKVLQILGRLVMFFIFLAIAAVFAIPAAIIAMIKE